MHRKTNAQKRGGRKKNIYLVLLVLFLLGFALSAGVWIRDKIRERREQDAFEQLAKQALLIPEREGVNLPEPGIEPATEPNEEPTVEPKVEVPELNLDWETLKARNEDIYSWIYLPETNINYPVLQHPKERDYYLRRDLDGNDAIAGCIYTQNLNEKDYSDTNTVLYGHNMKNGSMFQNLHRFEDGDYFDENRYIYIYLPDKALVYEIYGACEFHNALLPYRYDFDTVGGTEEFLNDLKNSDGAGNHFREELNIPEDGKLLTLSTCVAGQNEKRWLVVGVLIYEKEYDQEGETS